MPDLTRDSRERDESLTKDGFATFGWLTAGTSGRPCTDCALAIRPGSMVWDIKEQTYIPREVCQSCDEARRQAAILASRSRTSRSAPSSRATVPIFPGFAVAVGRNYAARSMPTPPPAQP